MTDFEDRLWSELVNDHGAELARMRPRPRGRRRRSWRAPIAAGGATLTAAAVAGALTFTASTSPPAYAVVVNPNGSVTLTINELIGVSGANAQLARLGVRARVARIEPHCAAHNHFIRVRFPIHADMPVVPELLRHGRGPFGRLRMIIHPGEIPRGDTLLMTVRPVDVTITHAVERNLDGTHSKALATTEGLYRGPAPVCSDGP